MEREDIKRGILDYIPSDEGMKQVEEDILNFIDRMCDDIEKDIITKFEGTSKYWLEHKFIEEVSKLDRGMYEVIIRKVK